MTTDPNIYSGEQPATVLDLPGELAAVIGAAEDPQQAAQAVLGVLRRVAGAPGRPRWELADFLAATAAHLRAHALCEVSVSYRGELQIAGVGLGWEGWAIADWAESLHAPVTLSGWNHDPGAAKATVSGTFGDPATPIPVQVWDVLPGGADLLGGHPVVTVTADRLRAWMATRTTTAAQVTGGGDRS